MIKYRFVAWVILGLLVGLNGFSQSKNSGSQNRCNAQSAAYQAAQDKCSDHNAQVAALKAQIEAYKHDQELLLSQCNQQKQQAACDQLTGLQDGHLAALEQQYYALASVGCGQSGLGPKEIAATCAADGNTPTSNQNKTAPTSPGKTPANNTSNAPPPPGRTLLPIDRSILHPRGCSSSPQRQEGPAGIVLAANQVLAVQVLARSALHLRHLPQVLEESNSTFSQTPMLFPAAGRAPSGPHGLQRLILSDAQLGWYSGQQQCSLHFSLHLRKQASIVISLCCSRRNHSRA